MFDFSTLQYNTENPTLTAILFTVVSAFVLSSLIAFTYEKTSRNVASPVNYIQALVLISIVAAMVMQAIGDSLARGLGMLGALAIIRFRTTIKNPRNMVFMFGSIAAGIACGVLGFVIAFVGTISFCIVAFLLRFTPFSQANNMVGIVIFEVLEDNQDQDAINSVLKEHSKSYVLKNYKITTTKKKGGLIQYEYQVKLKGEIEGNNLIGGLQQISGIKGIRLEFMDMDILI